GMNETPKTKRKRQRLKPNSLSSVNLNAFMHQRHRAAISAATSETGPTASDPFRSSELDDHVLDWQSEMISG
ncbi:hypothetical protein, partial [Ochrobactrum sp. S1502_03]|uniref:hypothetical protein n=1 Tax=Ochrobactrum sp. S1502_03 TaxID=3108451 RepID=UPI0037C7B444